MADLLVDTDVFVDHFRGARRLRTNGHRVRYSVITRCELFAGRSTDEDQVRRLLALFIEVPVDWSAAERAGHLRRQIGLRMADGLIAATALENQLILSTRNRRDFDRVRGLKIRQPG